MSATMNVFNIPKSNTWDTGEGRGEEYTYDGDTIEDIIVSHPVHEYYKAFIVLVDGVEIRKNQLEILVYQHEKGE